MLIKNLKLYVCLLLSVLCNQALAVDNEARGKVSGLLIGYPMAPMTLAVSINDNNEATDYPVGCDDAINPQGYILADMTGDNGIDREDSQAFFSLLQTAAVTGADVIVYYHLSNATFTANHCVIDAVVLLP